MYHSKIIKYLLCISEESLTAQVKNVATNMEEHRKRINTLTNKNITLKHEDEIISRDIRGMLTYKYVYS